MIIKSIFVENTYLIVIDNKDYRKHFYSIIEGHRFEEY